MCEQKSKFDIWDYINGDFPSSSTCEKKCPKKIYPGQDPSGLIFQNPITFTSNTQVVGGQAYKTEEWGFIFGDNFDFVLAGRDKGFAPGEIGGTLSRLYLHSGWSSYISQYQADLSGGVVQTAPSLSIFQHNGPMEKINLPEAKNESKYTSYPMFELLIAQKPTPPVNSSIDARVSENGGTLNITIGYYDNTTHDLTLELATVVHT